MPTFWTFAASTILIGLGAVTILTTANGYVQTTTEPALRGRVMALYMAILVGGTPIGAPIVGAVADGLGPRWALGIAAVVAAMVAALIGVGWLVFVTGNAAGAASASPPGDPSSDSRMPRPRHSPRSRRRPFRWCRSPPRPSRETTATSCAADFSEEVALTSPIPLPRLSARASERLASERLASERHMPDRHTPERRTPELRTPERAEG